MAYIHMEWNSKEVSDTTFEKIENYLTEINGNTYSYRIYQTENDLQNNGYKVKQSSQLSGGEQQRISIMRALSNNPRILLADEPTGNLDSENSKKVMEILNHLNKKGMTIIMVTHDLSLAEYGSRIIHIEDGKIVER